MKRILIAVLVALVTINSYGQSLIEDVNEQNIENSNVTFPYKLFPTQNMWNFIKLNTRNGKMWQVQYSMEDNERFQSPLNIVPLVEKTNQIDNRFTLYSTENTWTFILLDQIDGRTWQVQWSTDPDKRIIMLINQK